jgi:hypothetical protein
MKIEEIGNVVFIKNENNSKWLVMFHKQWFFDMVESMYNDMDAEPGPFLTVNGEMKILEGEALEELQSAMSEFEFETLSDAIATLDIYVSDHSKE